MCDIKVGGATSHGLSGGQKRRLCVAIQLMSMPSLIFLDEPTTGLDASSSLELIRYLHNVASSNRAVVLTIHQPRLEIYHMFHKILLLCSGQVMIMLMTMMMMTIIMRMVVIIMIVIK